MSWSKDYKKSIDCNSPKGFSQKAHCAGRKARQRGETTKSKSVNEMKLTKEQIIDVIMEGVDDPGILKCVFMAGGPGSGKSFTAKEVFGVGKEYTNSFSATGLKVVNSDTAFEKGLKDNGIDPKDLGRIEKEEPELWDKITKNPGGIRAKAKAITQKQQAFYEAGRLGMIIDGTGDDFGKIKKKVQHAKSLGYDCYMVFVNTSLEVALERNANRDRTLSDELVTTIWKDCQQNLGKFQGLFGGNMVIVDNTVYKPVDKDVQKAVDAFIRKPTYNPIGKEWIKTARALKKAKLIKAGKEVDNKPTIEERINLFFEENVPTDPEKWSYAKSQAKKKFDVYPSAYANAWASKKYKELGGGWRKSEGIHSFAAMSATKAALKRKKKKEGVSESYKGSMSDFGIDLVNALDNIGISSKAIKRVSRKGKGFEVRMSSYMSNQDTWEKLGKEMGAKLVDFQKGTINIGLYESVNEEIKKITSSQYKKLEDAIKKVNPKIKISLDSSAPGGFEIKIPDDNKWVLHTDKVTALVHKITGDHRNGRIFFEGDVNEASLKGTEIIPSNKKLSQLSDNEKLNILQSSGNIISFHIPDWAKGRYKMWQVISAGKIKKKKDLDGEIIYFLTGKGPQKSSPTYPTLKDLLNGVDWDTMEMRRESVNEGLFSDIMKGVKKGTPPYSIVVIVNNKVVKQVQVKEDRAIPAHFTTLKKEYPNSRIRVESSTGQILFEK